MMSLKPMLKEQFGLPTMLQYEFTLMCQIAVAPLLQKSVSPPAYSTPPPPDKLAQKSRGVDLYALLLLQRQFLTQFHQQ